MDRIVSVIVKHNVISDRYDCTVTYMIDNKLISFMKQNLFVIEDAYDWAIKKFEYESQSRRNVQEV